MVIRPRKEDMVAIWLFCFVGLGLTPAVFAGEHTQKIASLDARDLEVAGIPQGASRYVVLVRLGEPQEIIRARAPCGSNGWIENNDKYVYPGLTFIFEAKTGIREMVELTDPTHPTRRGLRVGQGAKEALALYGRHSVQEEGLLMWSGTANVQVILRNGVIERILLQ